MVKVVPNFSETSLSIPRVGPLKEMLSISSEGGKTLVRINSSSLGAIQECARKSYYLLDQKWHASNEAPATIFGSAIHASLEVFYGGDPATRKLPKLETMELMSYGHRVDSEDHDLLLRATRAFVEKADRLKALPETDKRSVQSGVWILHNYFKSFIDDPYVAYIDDKGPFIERDFSFRLYEDQELIIEYFGRIDLILKDLRTGNLYVTDHKTASMVGNDFYNRLKPNHQYTGYFMGAVKTFGLKPEGFLVNCLQVKPKPLTARGTAPHFPRQVTTRDDNDFEEFTDSVLAAVVNYLSGVKYGMWPLGHVNACAMYAGCQFLQVCSAPKSLRENILNAKFERN